MVLKFGSLSNSISNKYKKGYQSLIMIDNLFLYFKKLAYNILSVYEKLSILPHVVK